MVTPIEQLKLALFGCVNYFDAQNKPKSSPEYQRFIRGKIYLCKRLFVIYQINPQLMKIPGVKKCTSWKTLFRFMDGYDLLIAFKERDLSIPYEHEIPSLSELRGEVKVPERGPGGKFLPKARLLEVGTDGGNTQENAAAGVETVEGV